MVYSGIRVVVLHDRKLNADHFDSLLTTTISRVREVVMVGSGAYNW